MNNDNVMKNFNVYWPNYNVFIIIELIEKHVLITNTFIVPSWESWVLITLTIWLMLKKEILSSFPS